MGVEPACSHCHIGAMASERCERRRRGGQSRRGGRLRAAGAQCARPAGAARAGARRGPLRARLSGADRPHPLRGAGADRPARRDAQGCRRPAHPAGADRGGHHRPAGLRLSGRRAARLCPLRLRAARRRDQPAVALLPVRQGLSRDHLRPGGDEGALSGHRSARRAAASPRRRSISSASPSRFRAWCGSPSTTPAISPAASSSSICPRARRGASGCTRGSTIPNGSMSASSPRRSAPPSWSIRTCRSKTCSGGCSTRRRRCACSPTVPLSKGCRCSLEYVREVIARFGPEEREQMVDDDGFISVDCEFCSRLFPIKLSDLDELKCHWSFRPLTPCLPWALLSEGVRARVGTLSSLAGIKA